MLNAFPCQNIFMNKVLSFSQVSGPILHYAKFWVKQMLLQGTKKICFMTIYEDVEVAHNNYCKM